ELADLAIGDREQPRPEAVLVPLEAAQALGDGDEDVRCQVLGFGRGARPQEGEDRRVELSVEHFEGPRRSRTGSVQHVGELLAEGHGECLSAKRLEHLSRDRRVHRQRRTLRTSSSWVSPSKLREGITAGYL